MNAVVHEVGTGILRRLSGFRGYPKAGPGEDTFIHALCGCVVSVAHANAVVDAFTEIFPTVRQIRDVALNLRPKFEAVSSDREQWEQKYGKPDQNWSRNLLGGSHEQNKRRMLWQALRDTIYYTEGPGCGEKPSKFWTNQALRLRRDHPEELEAFRRDELSRGWDDLMKEDWANEAPAVALPAAPEYFKRIEQADIERAKAARETSSAVEDAPDDDDPTRWE